MRFLSAQVQPDKNFWVGGGAFYELSGHVDEHGSQFYVDLTGSTGQESQFYRGKIKLEKAFFGQGGAGSGGIGLMWFIVSTNSNIQFIDEQINASLAGLGLTNHIGNHLNAILPSQPSHVSNQIDPNTGLPPGNISIDPTTGLPISPKKE